MNYYHYVKKFSFRHALSVGFAVLLASLVEHTISFSNEYWVVLAALVVSQTTRGTPIRQGMIFLLTMVTAIFVSSLLSIYVELPAIIYFVLAISFLISGYFTFVNRPLPNQTYFLVILFPVILLIAALSPSKTVEYMQNRIADVVIGALIGFVFALWVFPVKLAKEFSEGIIPILHSLNNYISTLNEILQSNLTSYQPMIEKKRGIENALQAQQNMYPEWVYEVGFNRGLRSGFRFFLLNLERVTEVLFSMEFLLSRRIDELLLNALSQSSIAAMEQNQELLTILIEYFETNKVKETQSDFTSDISELENSLHRLIPSNLELLDISQQNLLITALVRDIRDLRGLLLQLVMALPHT